MFGQIQYLVNSYSLLTTTGSESLKCFLKCFDIDYELKHKYP